MFKPVRILVPTDFSTESDHALAAAVDIAGKYHADVDLLYVLDEVPQCSGDYCIGDEVYESMKKRMLMEARKKMRKMVTGISGAGKIKITPTLRWGSHADEILREMDENNIDLLVMAPHEEHKPWHRIMGHLSDKLMKRAQCEMLLVR